MARKMSKKVKMLLICAATAVAALAVILVVCLNFHSIYRWTQRQGFFKSPVSVNVVELQDVYEYSIDEIIGDSRVKLDQSLMLVNTQYMLGEDFKPQISEYKDTTVYMSDCMLDAYASLSAAVKDKTGNKLYVSSDFRTSDEQQALYDADPLTATLPGASEHQTGLALDVYVAYYAGDTFIKSPSGRFVNSNSWKYGFIIRYPSYGENVTGIRYEPWHIRYVGHPHADIIYNNHTTLEEYVEQLEVGVWYEAEGYLICRQRLSENNTLKLPSAFESCVISPDNTGCYIVTVEP